MSTERQPFGLNSFLPTGYMSKAEAFAKCLQDKLRTLGGGDETTQQNNRTDELPKVFGNFTEEEIAGNVFLQGPLSYKRRSIPEHCDRPLNGNTRNKYFGQVVDKRGMSSDSEESDTEDGPSVPALPRVIQLPNAEKVKINRLASMTSVDSASSWCSCEEGPDPEEEDEIVDALALQVKGSPPIQNARHRNFRRKGKESKVKKEKPAKPPPDADLFFDFDVECFSPVNVEGESDLFDGFELSLTESTPHWDSNGPSQFIEQENLLTQPRIVTPPPSPANGKFESLYEKMCESADATEFKHDLLQSTAPISQEATIKVDSSSSETLIMKHSRLESQQDASITQNMEAEQSEGESVDSECPNYYRAIYAKDSGICSCEETSSRTGDEEIIDIDHSDISNEYLKYSKDGSNSERISKTDQLEEESPEQTTKYKNLEFEDNDASDKNGAIEMETNEIQEYPSENQGEKKQNVAAPVKVMIDGVAIDERYLPTPHMKLRRCSSLKTWKTPPGTPGRKKMVRFADALGLDLADVRTFLDEIPKIPFSAFEDLHYEVPKAPPPPTTERTLIPMFQQPGTQIDFLQKVRQNNVSLESAILTDVTLLSISGIVRVRNVSFHKTVHVRYSKDSWATFSDLQATFIPNSSDGFCDNFSFTLYGHTLNVGDRLEFAIRYDCSAGQFWDNNMGQNYAFQCMHRPYNTPIFAPLGSSPSDTWTKFY